MKRKLAIVALVLVFNPYTLLFLWMGTATWADNHPKIGVDVPTVDWLPESASNVSYYKAYSWTAYEFDIDEAGFREWAGERELKPIVEPHRIERHSYRRYLVESARVTVWDEQASAEEAKHRVIVPHGLYHFRLYDNGGQTHLVYDQYRGRAYYVSTPR